MGGNLCKCCRCLGKSCWGSGADRGSRVDEEGTSLLGAAGFPYLPHYFFIFDLVQTVELNISSIFSL